MMDGTRTRRVLALVLATLAWARSAIGLDERETSRATLARMRADTRGQSDAKKVVATGAGVAASGGLVTLIQDYWLGGTLYQLSLSTVDLIQSLGSFGQVFSSFGSGIAGLVGAAMPTEIIDAGVFSSATFIRQQLGISGFLFGIIVTMLGVGLFLWFMTNIDWSPLKVFFGSRE